MKGKSVRVTMTQPEDWVERWKAKAQREGKTLSQWIGEQCNNAFPARVQKVLTKRPTVGKRSKKGNP